jgi:hypothetical protein
MKIIYRGFEINVFRDDSLSGDDYLYYSIYSVNNDKPCLADSFTSGSDTVEEYVGYMKNRIDSYYENPQDFEWNDGV